MPLFTRVQRVLRRPVLLSESPAARRLLVSLGFLFLLTACGTSSSEVLQGTAWQIRATPSPALTSEGLAAGQEGKREAPRDAGPRVRDMRSVAASRLGLSSAPAGRVSTNRVSRGGPSGRLDTTFGSGGVVQTPLPQGDAYAAGVAVQADGKVLIAGRIGNGRGADLLVVRYTTEGRLDPAFGRGGIVVTDLNTSFDSGNTLLLQPDGKIVVGGSTSVPYRPGSNETKSDFALVRYTPDGHLDPSFGQGGAVRTALGTGHDGAYAVALQPDGKLLLTGQTSNGNDDDIGVVRYLPDGRLDVTFGQGGKVVTAIGSRDDVGYGVAVQADGRIVVAGVAAQQSDDVVLVRYTPAGKPDLSFGQGGVVSTDLGGGADGVSSVALQPGGKVLVAGSTWNGQDHDFALLRYTAAGDLDATFGAGGRALTPVGSSQDVGTALVQSQDSIVLVGRTLSGNTYNVGLVQYGVNGVLNAGFGQGGRLTVPVGGSSALVVGALRQADGRLVLAGTSSASGKSSLFLLRLWP